MRNLEIQKSTQKRNEIIQNIREQKEEKAKSSNFRDELMVMMVNSMQQQQMFTNMIMAKMFGVDFNTVTVNQNQSNVRGMLFSQPSTQKTNQHETTNETDQHETTNEKDPTQDKL